MAKIFISYKYRDKYVRQNPDYNLTHWLTDQDNGNYLTARDYVNHLTEVILTDHQNKAEKDNEDLSFLSEETIQRKLYDRIYDSTLTIVLISKHMKNNRDESLQWIPREISYSIKEKTRDDRTSYTNGILAVALPDEMNSYNYAVINKPCGLIEWQTQDFFKIIGKNMFNRKVKNQNYCSTCLNYHHDGSDHSFIYPVKWDDFVNDHNAYINHALLLKDTIDDFDLTKNLD